MGRPTHRKTATAGSSPAMSVSGWRILPFNGGDHSAMIHNRPNLEVSPDQLEVSLSETVFGFLEQGGQGSSPSTTTSELMLDVEDEEEGEEHSEHGLDKVEENKAFWESHHKLLQESICKTSSLERRIRNAAKEALKEAQNEGNFCTCRRPAATGTCRSCLLREIASRLRDAGYDCAVCRTKWRSSPDMPSGEHTFLDVVDESIGPKRKQVRVIIELCFRAEFEIGRASEEYKQLVTRLPEAFVGRAERLNTLIKVLCSAAKRCMDNNKMHMGPWRKQNYMQAKWFSPCARTESSTPTLARGLARSEEPIKPRPASSMLTVALLDFMPNLPNKLVAVV